MAEVGLVASILGIAGAGAKLSIGLYEVASAIGDTGREVRAIAKELTGFSSVLRHFASVIRSNPNPPDQARRLAEDLIASCDNTLDESKALLDVLKPLIERCGRKRKQVGLRIRWLFQKSKFVMHQGSLESLKSTLNLLVTVLTYDEAIGREKESTVADLKLHIEASMTSVKEDVQSFRRILSVTNSSSTERPQLLLAPPLSTSISSSDVEKGGSPGRESGQDDLMLNPRSGDATIDLGDLDDREIGDVSDALVPFMEMRFLQDRAIRLAKDILSQDTTSRPSRGSSTNLNNAQGLFGSSGLQSSSNLFGSSGGGTKGSTSNVFGSLGQGNKGRTSNVFGGFGQDQQDANNTSNGIFGQQKQTIPTTSGIFGQSGQATNNSPSLFGGISQNHPGQSSNAFGTLAKQAQLNSPGLFGNVSQQAPSEIQHRDLPNVFGQSDQNAPLQKAPFIGYDGTARQSDDSSAEGNRRAIESVSWMTAAKPLEKKADSDKCSGGNDAAPSSPDVQGDEDDRKLDQVSEIVEKENTPALTGASDHESVPPKFAARDPGRNFTLYDFAHQPHEYSLSSIQSIKDLDQLVSACNKNLTVDQSKAVTKGKYSLKRADGAIFMREVFLRVLKPGWEVEPVIDKPFRDHESSRWS